MRRGVFLSSCVAGLVLVVGAFAQPESAAEAGASEDRRTVERRAAEVLASGGDASELLERARELPETAIRRPDVGVAERRLARERKAETRVGVEAFEEGRTAPPQKELSTPSAAEDAAAQRFEEISKILESAGSPVHWERFERARAAHAVRSRSDALKASDGAPRPDAEPIVLRSSLLPYRPASLAARPPALEPQVVPPYLDATDPAEAPADRSPSPSAPLWEAILEQAAALDYDYVAIFE
ncbi:MAG: hypothetical protein AAFX50_11955, partial [Acidobacteriota bacterium]